MFVVFLATVASVELVYSLQLAINRSALVLGQRQAWYFALGGEAWAVEELRRDLETDQEEGRQRDWNGEDWATKQVAAPIEGGSVSGNIIDLQGRFNVNNLVDERGEPDPAQVEMLRRIVGNWDLEEGLVDVIVDWVDRNDETGPLGGAETSQYRLLDPPYLAPNAPMADISEVNLLAGMDSKASERLRENLTALPRGTELNVNTMSADVMMGLADNIDPTLATQLAEVVAKAEDFEGYESAQEFLELLGITQAPTAELSVSSSYFQVNVNVETVYGEVVLESVLHRAAEGRPRVISRSVRLPE
jgi:general secretion pathway protein K